ncbi:MAG: lipopolysaccharide assembly protein LapA domain-containing protein [bacterium]|nr:lipopolysaccharide assembly protein LapA domain-containing protein [bacterium]
MLGLKLLFFLVITIFIAIFATQNNTLMTIKLFNWESPEISLVIVIFGSILVGFVWALIPASIRIVSLKHKVQKLEDYMEIKDRNTYRPGAIPRQ